MRYVLRELIVFGAICRSREPAVWRKGRQLIVQQPSKERPRAGHRRKIQECRNNTPSEGASPHGTWWCALTTSSSLLTAMTASCLAARSAARAAAERQAPHVALASAHLEEIGRGMRDG